MQFSNSSAQRRARLRHLVYTACLVMPQLGPAAMAQTMTAPAPTTAPATSGSKPEDLGTLVVTATGIPTEQKRVASSVTVITAQDLQDQQLRTVPNALASVPGLNVVQTGGPGGLTSVFMRGTNSDHVKVLIDGIDVSDPSNSNASFDFGPARIPSGRGRRRA